MSSIGYVLAFHSQIISGNEFATNDHVALDETLRLVRELRIPVLRLADVVHHLERKEAHKLPNRYVCITFDDGPDYDWYDLSHPHHGPQTAMHAILRKHSMGIGPFWLSRTPATSFVIASPDARSDISGDASTNPDRMADSWWKPAQKSGLIDIANHGWDHVHPSVRGMKGRENLIDAFHKVETLQEARLQIDTAGEYICAKAGPKSGRLFAYPYGQVSDFLADEYFPKQSQVHAAFTIVPEPLTASSELWRAPRYVSRGHFTSVDEARGLLEGKL